MKWCTVARVINGEVELDNYGNPHDDIQALKAILQYTESKEDYIDRWDTVTLEEIEDGQWFGVEVEVDVTKEEVRAYLGKKRKK